MRSYRMLRGSVNPTRNAESALSPKGWRAIQAESGRPLARATSRARSTRWVSPGGRRAAVAGSRRWRSAWRAGRPSVSRRRRRSARTAGSPCGIGADACEERLQVEAAAADDDGEAAAGVDVGDGGAGAAGEFAGGVALGGVEDVEEVVGDALAVLFGGFGGAEVEAAVGLEGVGVDDLAAAGLGEGQGQAALAYGGGAYYGDDGGRVGGGGCGRSGGSGRSGREWREWA